MKLFKMFFVLIIFLGFGSCQDRSVIERSVIDIVRETRDLSDVSTQGFCKGFLTKKPTFFIQHNGWIIELKKCEKNNMITINTFCKKKFKKPPFNSLNFFVFHSSLQQQFSNRLGNRILCIMHLFDYFISNSKTLRSSMQLKLLIVAENKLIFFLMLI